MKNYVPLFVAIESIFSFGCFAQGTDNLSASTKLANPELISYTVPNDELVVVSYHVEERINSNFGSHITTYNVSNLSLVRTYDLGPNNTRTITPTFGKAKIKAIATPLQAAGVVVNEECPKSSADIRAVVQPWKSVMAAPQKKPQYAYINITDTYERILNKGYKSADMFKRVANSRFFDGDLHTAAKWYSELFALTTDLEDVYYYRYAKALRSISQIEKADEMMAIFESKVSKNP